MLDVLLWCVILACVGKTITYLRTQWPEIRRVRSVVLTLMGLTVAGTAGATFGLMQWMHSAASEAQKAGSEAQKETISTLNERIKRRDEQIEELKVNSEEKNKALMAKVATCEHEKEILTPKPESTVLAVKVAGRKIPGDIGRDHSVVPGGAVAEFKQLTSSEQKILRTLWFYQNRWHPTGMEQRWGFTIDSASTDFAGYAQGIAKLLGRSKKLIYMGYGENQSKCALTDYGISLMFAIGDLTKGNIYVF